MSSPASHLSTKHYPRRTRGGRCSSRKRIFRSFLIAPAISGSPSHLSDGVDLVRRTRSANPSLFQSDRAPVSRGVHYARDMPSPPGRYDLPPLAIVNDVDDKNPLLDFVYSDKIWLGDGVEPPRYSDLDGCDCPASGCDPATCKCAARQARFTSEYFLGFGYRPDGRLRQHEVPIFECNHCCRCQGGACTNRVVQRGATTDIYLKKTSRKGWGVFTRTLIRKDTFVGTFAGELLSPRVGQTRERSYTERGLLPTLALDPYYLRQQYRDFYVIDSHRTGNFTRFINHSCLPNCRITPCYIEEQDIRKPLMAFFATEDVPANTELTLSYSGFELRPHAKHTQQSKPQWPCYCDAPNCRGFTIPG
ncbi:SET domain-containing protein [Mycena sanguinolenta]|uniref:SET domain-containing protein n=1 Tax=Mycena sanguinolenta TaxID=230812 RepID=A0A8H6X8C7_9AGAR|nr:SET domain-containing protein [Mycena sanguinolenta]